MKTPRIVVVGSVNVDLILSNDRFPVVGETVTGGHLLMAGGGKGANQAMAAARLGAKVTLVGRVGRDVFGEKAAGDLEEAGVETSLLVRDPGAATGVALILVDGQGNNMISVASGANRSVEPGDVERAADAIRGADAVLVQLEIPLAAVRLAARLAAAAGVPVILDPAPVPDEPLPADLLRDCAIVKPNETEATRLTGITVRDEVSARAAAAKLVAAGARQAIVTLGSHGAVWCGRGGIGAVPAFLVETVDATAAGDAFNAGLACALARGALLAQAVRYASLVAALSTTRAGAQPSLPTGQEVHAFAEGLPRGGRDLDLGPGW